MTEPVDSSFCNFFQEDPGAVLPQCTNPEVFKALYPILYEKDLDHKLSVTINIFPESMCRICRFRDPAGGENEDQEMVTRGQDFN